MNAPAGFWKRYVAYFLDALILCGAVQLLVLAVHAVTGDSQLGPLLALLQSLLHEDAARLDPFAVLAQALALLAEGMRLSGLLYLPLAAGYFISFEASAWQATPGKRALRLVVTDLHGSRLAIGRAGLRFLAATLSWLSLNLGHALAAWTREHRALHDYLAGSRVLLGDPEARMPTWGWVIVGFSAAATLLLALATMAAVLFYLLVVGLA